MSGASLFYWRGVVLLLFIPWPFALTVFLVRIHPGNGLGPWGKTWGAVLILLLCRWLIRWRAV